MKIIDTKKIFETKFLNMISTKYEDTKGKISEWFHVTRPSVKDIVMIVPIRDLGEETKIIMTKEYRVPIKDYEYGFPAGLVDENESVEEAITRELKEETGLDVKEIESYTQPLYNSAGLTDESIRIALVYVDGEISTKRNEDSEEIEVLELAPSEARDICTNVENKVGAKAWLMVHLLLAQLSKIL